MVQETTKLPVTSQHAHDLPVSGEDGTFVHDKNRLLSNALWRSKKKDSALLRYEENTMGAFERNDSKHYGDGF